MRFADFFDQFDHVYIINLPDRTDRRDETIAELARLGVASPTDKITFFEATRPKDKGEFPTLGTLGLFLTQIRLLKEAQASGHHRILVLEDDVHFHTISPEDLDALATDLQSSDWDIASLGYNVPETPPSDVAGLTPWPEGVIGAQIWSVQGAAIKRLHDYLELALTRPLGHPMGGAMHFDAAFYMIRVAHPDVRFHLATPSLAGQRSSRTDIHDLRFFDRIEPFRSIVALLRRVKNLRRS